VHRGFTLHPGGYGIANARRGGFTTIELLTVVSIIAILSTLILAAALAVRGSADATRSRAIVAAVCVALETIAAERGSAPAPAPHPLAGSRAPRATFVRDGTTAGYAGAVASGGLAYRAADPAAVPSAARGAVLLPGDRWAGAADPAGCPLPFAYGARRAELGVVGSGTGIETWRRLPRPERRYSDDGTTLRTPLDGPAYPAGEFLVDAGGTVPQRIGATRHAIEASFGAEQLSELAALGAVRSVEAADLAGGLLARDPDGDPPTPRWESGRYFDGSAWVVYALAGTALYDAWGNEICYRLSADGRTPIVTSAGKDGVLAIDPGPDRVLQSPPTGPPAGDDRDGAADNIVEGTDR